MAIAHSVTLMQAAAPPKLNTTQQTFRALERAKGNTSITEDDIRRRYPSYEDLERAGAGEPEQYRDGAKQAKARAVLDALCNQPGQASAEPKADM
jgi:hypothetical protein